jgi:hypothetical protein
MKRHHCTLIIHTDDSEDEKYCLRDCPMANGEGWPYDCDFLKCELKSDKDNKYKTIRGEGCPWQSTKVVEYTK